jgi:hypothetical protein
VNVVREDPHVKGLLYAGTELDVYVSFNDGDAWQPLTLNLPHTSVRDLAVHGDDLAIATHGRGFWILDDVSPLRELARGARTPAEPQLPSPKSRLYAPATTYRLRRDEYTDTPLPPEFPAGQNPPDGAIIDYYLDAAPSAPVTLEIRTASGALVRRFASDDRPEPVDEKSVNVPTYWIRPPQRLPASKGMHRFVWDLRYAPPGAVQHEYPISAIFGDTPREPVGVLAVPGRYSVALTINGHTVRQPLIVKMDPRVSATPLGLSQQFSLAAKLVEMMNRSYAAWQQASGDVKRQLATLNRDLATAYEVIEGADAAPTAQAAKSMASLEQRTAALAPGQHPM